MSEISPGASSTNLSALEGMDAAQMTAKIIELQDALVQSQEKNLMLSAQLRELERQARDGRSQVRDSQPGSFACR